MSAVITGVHKDKLTLVLEYFIPGARWVPQVQCLIDTGGPSAQLIQRAVVSQATGEDWTGVALELSTADPLRYTELPALQALRIGKAQPPPPRPSGYRPAPKGAERLFEDFDRDRRRSPAPPPDTFQPERLAIPPLSPPAWAPEPALDELYDAEEAWEEACGEPAPAMEMSKAMPPPSAAPRPRRRSSPKLKKTALRPPDPPAARPRYLELRLGDPTGAGRATLHREAPADRALEALQAKGIELPFNVHQLHQRALRRALSPLQLPLPPGATDVRHAAGAYDYTYTADDRVDVPADGTFHAVPLGARESACSLRYVVVPREAPHVFRVAHLSNPLKAPMLPGPVEVYVDGDYVLSTSLPSVPPHGEFTLGLGVEQAIAVARNTRFSSTRSSAQVVATAELHHHIQIDLNNHLPRAAAIEVRERIPQPKEDAEVVVEEQTVTPPWEAWDQREQGEELVGGRRWSLDLSPGGEATLRAHYVIKIYAKNELVGGDRREA